jgi:hypothetical protein
MATPRPRIKIPTVKNALGVFDLAGQILAKHQTDGANSPIRGQLKADLEAVANDITEGVNDNAEVKALEKKIEEIYQRRNNRALRVQPLLPRVSKALQGEYGATGSRKLGDHGFVVDDSPKAPKAAKPKPQA